MMECLDNVGCICEVFRRFPTCGIGGVVESSPLDQVKQSRPLATAINPAVQDPMNFPLIGVVQLDRWWWIYGSVGNLTRASGLQQRHMEHRRMRDRARDRPSWNACDDTSIIRKGPRKQWSSFFEGRVVLMFCESSQTVSLTLNWGVRRHHDAEWASFCLRARDIWL